MGNLSTISTNPNEIWGRGGVLQIESYKRKRQVTVRKLIFFEIWTKNRTPEHVGMQNNALVRNGIWGIFPPLQPIQPKFIEGNLKSEATNGKNKSRYENQFFSRFGSKAVPPTT